MRFYDPLLGQKDFGLDLAEAADRLCWAGACPLCDYDQGELTVRERVRDRLGDQDSLEDGLGLLVRPGP